MSGAAASTADSAAAPSGAVSIVALSAVILYMAAARATANWMAMLLAFIYAFGTSSLSVSSQALWQHGPAQLALAAAIYCLMRARDQPRWAGYAGLPLAFEVITRPADALIAAPLGLYVLLSYRRLFNDDHQFRDDLLHQ